VNFIYFLLLKYKSGRKLKVAQVDCHTFLWDNIILDPEFYRM
jgi:hypothetical protein